MPDKKNDNKKGGLRGFFRKKESIPEPPKPTPAHNAESKPQEPGQRPSVRRSYTPRYAERDMILSVPVEDRPDLVAKAKEKNLKRVCSDIGFSTGSSSRAPSLHARHSSMNLSALSTHPNLHISRQAAWDASTPGSSSSSLRALAMQRYSSMPAVPLSQSANSIDRQWKGLSYNGPTSSSPRPPRASQSMMNIQVPHMIPETQMEDVDRAFKRLDTSAVGENTDNEIPSRASTPSSGYTPEIRRRPMYEPIRHKSYFSHKKPLPDLRSQKIDKGKGKEQAEAWGMETGKSPEVYHQPSHRASSESMSDYVVHTKALGAVQSAPAKLPPPPPPSNAGSATSFSASTSTDQTQDSRTPSLAESESYNTDHSSYNNDNDNDDSQRTSSVSTAMTVHTDGETEKAVKLDDSCDGKESANATPLAEEDGFDLKGVQATADKIRAVIDAF